MIEIKAKVSKQMHGYIRLTVIVGTTSIDLGLVSEQDFDIMLDDLTIQLHDMLLLSDVLKM